MQKKLEEQYQSIIEFGNSAITYGVICLLANGTIRNDYYVKKTKINIYYKDDFEYYNSKPSFIF